MADGLTGSTEYPDAKLLLTAAQNALGTGQARLAIHLYSAAFESTSSRGDTVPDELIDGMRVALNLAFELSDKATVESIINLLEPFNTQEQKTSDLERLRSMQQTSVEALIIDATKADLSDGIKGVARILSEATDGFDGVDFNQWMKQFRNALGLSPEEEREINTGSGLVLPADSELFGSDGIRSGRASRFEGSGDSLLVLPPDSRAMARRSEGSLDSPSRPPDRKSVV